MLNWSKKEDNRLQDDLHIKIGNNSINIAEVRQQVETLQIEFNHYREDVNSRVRVLTNLLNEKLDAQKEELELVLIGLEKSFSNKINNISEGKPIVTDLLRQIAQLQSIKDASESRRSTKDILEKMKEVNDEFLELDLKDKDTREILAKLGILKWILGEDK